MHEMDSEERIETLHLLKTVAQKIIIADYIVPFPKDLSGLPAKTIEFLTGENHFTNYRKFVKSGRLPAPVKATVLLELVINFTASSI